MTWDTKYDEMLNELDKDDRVGTHVAVVDEVSEGEWPDGRKYTKILTKLETARDSFADATISAPTYLNKDELKKLEGNQRRGVQLNLQLLKSLHDCYGVSYPEIGAKLVFGTKLGVTTISVKNKKTGKAYIRIAAFKPLAEARKGEAAQAASTDSVPF